ncbi:hypothetical protein [Terasakiella sp.]|uniref:hypothetical protein n=1 Tax=Terasakiella sp. TaxID=2034861 RepID=UPI003B0013A2
MKNDDIDYSQHLKILQEELIPAMGCTEPIAIAYGAAKACAVLGELPQKVDLQVTANLIKNSKSVVVPNTGGLKGIGAAAAAGIIAGDSDEGLQVLSRVKSCQYGEVQDYLDSDNIDVKSLESEHTFDMIVTVYGVKSKATVQISRYHTNIVLITKDDEILFKQDVSDVSVGTNHTDRGCLSIESILDFAQVVEIADIQDLLEQQITYNSQIADEGLKGNWGANIGATLMQVWGKMSKRGQKRGPLPGLMHA